MSFGIDITVRNLGADTRSRMIRARGRVLEEVGAFLREELESAKGHLEEVTPIRTGRMHDSWAVGMYGNREGRLSNTAPYATFLFTGTRPHAIPGAFGRPLPFGTNANFHPGTQRNSGLIRTMNAESQRIRSEYSALGARLAITFWRQTLSGGEP